MFWFVVPETFSFGSVSLLTAFILAAISEKRPLKTIWYVFVNVATFAFVITNWMAALFATLIGKSSKRIEKILLYSFCLILLLWGVQKTMFTYTGFILEGPSETRHMLRDDSGGIFRIVPSFVYHTVIMPAFKITNDPARTKDEELSTILSTQFSDPGSGSAWGMAGVILWTLILAIGTSALFSLREQKKFRLLLGLVLCGQLGMHVIYGNETFLYALHFLVLLIPLAALGSLTKLRFLVRILVIMLIPCLAVNNYTQFLRAIEFLRNVGTQRQQAVAHMNYRADDPWPRGSGHVLLAYPGTEESDKAYYEPGGSFSPSVGSFGVSIWVLNDKGSLLQTSDTLPIKDIHQKFVETDQPVPAISADTDYYEALWSPLEPGKWALSLKQKRNDVQLQLVVRSVGPAGGPIYSLASDKNNLSVNGRWNIALNPFEGKVLLGDEIQADWVNQGASALILKSVKGWGYAKFLLPVGGSWTMTIIDPALKINTDLKYTTTRPSLQLSLPDEQFIASLNAQVAHLMMNISRLQTHPGDPMEYPYPVQREAAYELLALAKAGQLDAAKQLSVYLAENDFFGGTGPDADAPGLAIWVLTELADLLNNPQYDQLIWPHIRRKTEFIEHMLTTTTGQTYGTAQGVPTLKARSERFGWMLVTSEGVKDGLIKGKVEQHFPVFYVNAVSYLGLVNASDLADKVGASDDASRWRDRAAALKQSWKKVYAHSLQDQNNPRTYMNPLWPSQIAEDSREVLMKNLLQRWEKSRDKDGNFRYTVDKSYFAAGAAHQWLWLNDLEHTWKILRWFWNKQNSPGLYTWWETLEKGSTYNEWEKARGWVNPKVVTPHYGTAAQVLLLQIDMLGYIEKKADHSTIVIGAGVPAEWLSHPMEVKGLLLPHRTVDWAWDGKAMHVTIHGAGADIKLGPAFGADVPVQVTRTES